METSSSSSRGRHGGGGRGSIQLLGTDLLCAVFALLDPFTLVRCSVVCKAWYNIISKSSLLQDLFQQLNPYLHNKNVSSLGTSMRICLEDLAMEAHKLALSSGFAEVHQWIGHSVRVNSCRMRRGLLVTGVGDKVLRLWSAESYKCLDEYSVPGVQGLLDFDFDETKIVGLTGTRICIWRRNAQRSILQSREGVFSRAICMCYSDPDAVIGCEDGRAHVFDMYSGSSSRILRLQGEPITSMTLTDDQLILSGSTFGTVAIADLSSGERLGVLRSSFSPTGMKSLSYNKQSSLVFAGSTSGYAHCWDIRTLRPLWERRISPNVIYSTSHMLNDTSTLAVGGLDGVLRILNQSTGEILSSFVVDGNKVPSNTTSDGIQRRRATPLLNDTTIDNVPRHLRPPITCLAVGMKKIATIHNEKYIRMWRFHE